MPKLKKHVLYLDVLRLVAMFGIVLQHVSSGMLWNINGGAFIPSLFIQATLKWSTVVFVMISGALLLENANHYSGLEFLKKRVIRIFIPFLVWYIIYRVFYTYFGMKELPLDWSILTDFISNENSSPHFWFIYMIFSLYLITPVMAVFVQNASEKQFRYFFIYWLFAMIGTSLSYKLANVHVEFHIYMEFTKYTGFYVLGYYLHSKEITISNKLLLLIPVIMILAFVTTYYASIHRGKYDGYWVNRNSVFITPLAFLIFVMYKRRSFLFLRTKSRLKNLIVNSSKLSYGIFLIHMIVIELYSDSRVSDIGLSSTMFFGNKMTPVIGIPIFGIVVFLTSLLIVSSFNKIPFIRKLLV